MMQEPKLTFQAFRLWFERKRDSFDLQTRELAHICCLDLNALELNLPEPGKVLLTIARNDLGRLECALTPHLT